jgi:hypothetical protein
MRAPPECDTHSYDCSTAVCLSDDCSTAVRLERWPSSAAAQAAVLQPDSPHCRRLSSVDRQQCCSQTHPTAVDCHPSTGGAVTRAIFALHFCNLSNVCDSVAQITQMQSKSEP